MKSFNGSNNYEKRSRRYDNVNKREITCYKCEKKGPYYIHKEIGKGAYKLRTLDGKVLKTSHNIKHIKKYFEMKE